MLDSGTEALTRQLQEAVDQRGDLVDELFGSFYEELHGRARRQRRGWVGDHTLDTTALLHEAYLKLARRDEPVWESRAHFLAAASRAMRHILVDYARRRCADKRGGGARRLTPEDVGALKPTAPADVEQAETLLALDRALDRLSEIDERQAKVVEYRFFGGMSVAEAGATLGVSVRTIKRDWAHARAWLRREMVSE
jgi:RNA polymerase sigma factor (TIGR02999 family)